jgi:hypothetical protein
VSKADIYTRGLANRAKKSTRIVSLSAAQFYVSAGHASKMFNSRAEAEAYARQLGDRVN